MVDEPTTRRRFLQVAGATTVAGAVGLAGCSGGGDGGPTRLTFGGTTSGSAPYQLGLTWAQQVEESTDNSLNVTVQDTGGFDANIRLAGADSIDMGASTSPNFQAAAMGVTPFEEQFEVNALFTCAVFPFPIAFTTTDTDVDIIADFAGKQVVTGPPGSSTHTYARLYFLANGLDWESVEPVRVGGQEAYQNLKDDQVAGVITAGLNNVIGPEPRQFLETTDNPQLVVPQSNERIDRLVNADENIPNYPLSGGVDWELSLEQFGTAWENSVRSDDESYSTVAGTNTVFTTLDVSDENARQLTNVAIENREALANATALWAGWAQNPGRFATVLPTADEEAAPYHPGAAEALREHDLWEESAPVAER